MPHHPTSSRSWKVFLLGLFALFATGMATGFIMAARDGARLVDRDYYEQGVHYGDLSARQRAAAQAGWRFQVSRQGSDLLVTLSDGEGRGVPGVEVGFVAAADRGNPAVVLQPLGEGRYLLSRSAVPDVVQGTMVASSPTATLSTRIRVLE